MFPMDESGIGFLRKAIQANPCFCRYEDIRACHLLPQISAARQGNSSQSARSPGNNNSSMTLSFVSDCWRALRVSLAGWLFYWRQWGLCGIMSYAVVQRKQELGLRMALGAAPRAILGLILRDSAGIVGLGLVVGIAAAAFSTHLARALLFGLAPNDPTTFIAASIVLLAASLGAASIPAYRAAETDPMIALRHE